MSYEPRLVFLNSRILGQSNSLEAVIAAIQEIEYEVCNLKVGNHKEQLAFWSEYDSHTELGVAYEKRQLSLEAKNKLETFEIFLRIHWEKSPQGEVQKSHTSAVSFQTALFSRRECNPSHYSRLFLDFGKSLYEVLLPDFGWLDICEPAGYTWYEDVDSLAVPHLYWANFFSPSYVNKLEREKILSAPVWAVEKLSDGGLVCVLSSALGLLGEDRVSIESVKAYLGI